MVFSISSVRVAKRIENYLQELLDTVFFKNLLEVTNTKSVRFQKPKRFYKDEIHSPDCSGYPATSAGKSFGVRSNSEKRELLLKNIILML